MGRHTLTLPCAVSLPAAVRPLQLRQYSLHTQAQADAGLEDLTCI